MEKILKENVYTTSSRRIVRISFSRFLTFYSINPVSYELRNVYAIKDAKYNYIYIVFNFFDTLRYYYWLKKNDREDKIMFESRKEADDMQYFIDAVKEDIEELNNKTI